MGSQENADLIRSGYEAFSRGDVATVVGLFSPDIAWHVPGQGPIAGDYHGPDEVLGFFGVLASETGGSFELSVHDLLASDDHVVALCTQKAERNGKTFTGNLVHVWHVSDGKATEFWGIPEDAAAADEFWAPA